MSFNTHPYRFRLLVEPEGKVVDIVHDYPSAEEAREAVARLKKRGWKVSVIWKEEEGNLDE